MVWPGVARQVRQVLVGKASSGQAGRFWYGPVGLGMVRFGRLGAAVSVLVSSGEVWQAGVGLAR